MSRRPTLSVVVPVRNEEAVLPALHRRLMHSIAATSGGFEVLYVDDGSTDGTRQLLELESERDARVGYIRLSRNFGKEAAVSAGLAEARGAATVVIDGDLQDPPELIPSMLAAWRGGADVVNMRRRARAGESWLKRVTAYAFYRVMNRLSDVPIPVDTGDYRLLSRRAVDAINALPERSRMMKGLFAWIGFSQATIDYDREPRAAGHSKWRYWKLWNLALEGITGFSVAPLKVATYVGFATALSAFAFAAFMFVKTLAFGDPARGFPTLIVVISFLGGLQLMAIGVLGEYLARLFVESKGRPLYLVDELRAPSQAAQPPWSRARVEHAPARPPVV
ncbi:MAG: glycosyltransferase family 2 protein [Gammaproteobacteria bacterium]|nr:glycosyltransferase family 2 protein [Gammaproteobacteria bacterium]